MLTYMTESEFEFRCQFVSWVKNNLQTLHTEKTDPTLRDEVQWFLSLPKDANDLVDGVKTQKPLSAWSFNVFMKMVPTMTTLSSCSIL